jgi:hypothetical protein
MVCVTYTFKPVPMQDIPFYDDWYISPIECMRSSKPQLLRLTLFVSAVNSCYTLIRWCASDGVCSDNTKGTPNVMLPSSVVVSVEISRRHYFWNKLIL